VINLKKTKNVTSLASASVVSQFSFVIFAPLLYRLFPVESFGDLAIFTAFSTTFTVFFHFQLSQGIILEKSHEKAFKLIFSLVSISIVMFLLFFAATIIFTGSLDFIYNFNFVSIKYLIPLQTLMFSLNEIFRQWFSRTKKYNKISIFMFLCTFLNPLFACVFYYLGFKNNGLVYSALASQFFGLLYFTLHFLNNEFFSLWEFKKVDFKKSIIRNQDFLKFNLFSEFINRLTSQSPNMIIGFLFGIPAVALFDLALKIVNIPIKISNFSVGETFKMDAINDLNKNNNYKKTFIRYSSFLIIVSVIILILFYAFSELFIDLYFGSKWIETNSILKVLIWYAIFKLIVSPLSYSYFISKKLREDLFVHFYMALSLVLISALSYFLNLELNTFLILFSFNFIIIYTYTYIRSYMFSKKKS